MNVCILSVKPYFSSDFKAILAIGLNGWLPMGEKLYTNANMMHCQLLEGKEESTNRLQILQKTFVPYWARAFNQREQSWIGKD